MVAKVASSKEPIGLIAWHPDRLARNSIDGGQKRENWVEPLREWIKSSSEAEIEKKCKSYHELKQSVEKIGTNRLLLNRKVQMDFSEPWRFAASRFAGRGDAEGRSLEATSSSLVKNLTCLELVGLPGVEPGLHPPHGCVLPSYSSPFFIIFPYSIFQSLNYTEIYHIRLNNLIFAFCNFSAASICGVFICSCKRDSFDMSTLRYCSGL